MAIWLFGVVSLLLFAVLGVMDGFGFDESSSSILLSPMVFWLMTGLLFVAVIIFTSASIISQKHGRRRILQVSSLIVIMALFVLRGVVAHLEFNEHTPLSRHLIQAKAYIPIVSDGVYDAVQGSSYRQEVILSQVTAAPVQADARTLTNANPFLANDAPSQSIPSHSSDDLGGVRTHDAGLERLDGATVMMSANPNFSKQDLSVLNTLKPGDVADVVLLITPIERTVSASGFDANQWLRTRYIHANARIIQVGAISTHTPQSFGEGLIIALEQYRHRLRTHFYQDWHKLTTEQAQAQAVTLSLLTGDRALIDKSTKEMYQLAGISHLLAISGAHVLFLAMMLATVLLWVLDRFAMSVYQAIPRWQIRMAIMVAASLLYALFTGFDVPAVRTVYMLMAAWVVRYFALPISALSVLCVVALVMVWLDPYVLWQAGFWLSFIAVLLLMRYEMDDAKLAQSGAMALGWVRTKQIIKLQCWLFFAMLPLSVMLFGKVSIWGLVVNVFAVSLFGAVIVPINLIAGAVFVIAPSISDMLWGVSAQILQLLHTGLEFTLVEQLGGISAWLYAPFGMAGFVLCFMMVALLLLPKVLPKTVLCVPLVALYLIGMPKHSSGIELIWLDGDSPNLSQYLLKVHDDSGTQHWLLLSEQGAQIKDNYTNQLIDTLHRQGVGTLDGVIVQSPSAKLMPVVAHIQQTIPIHRYWQAGRHEPLPSLYHEPCTAGMAWQDDTLSIRALTGWQMIDDERVQHCELEIVSDLPMLAVDMPSMDTDATDLDDDAQLPQPSLSNPSNQQGVQMVTMTGGEPLLWQLWAMLCDSESSLAVTPKQGYQPLILATQNATDTKPITKQLPTATIYPSTR